MEKRNKRKPIFDKKDCIEGEFSELLNDVENEVNGSLDNTKSIDDFLYDSINSVDVKNEDESISEEYHEIIKSAGLSPVKYFVSRNAFNVVDSIKKEYKLEDKNGTSDDAIFRLAVDQGKINLVNGDLKDVYVIDNEFGGVVKTLEETKYLVSPSESDKDIRLIFSFKEITMDSALPGDTIRMGDLNYETQKKINNVEYGGSSHKIFEPFDHNWESEGNKE